MLGSWNGDPLLAARDPNAAAITPPGGSGAGTATNEAPATDSVADSSAVALSKALRSLLYAADLALEELASRFGGHVMKPLALAAAPAPNWTYCTQPASDAKTPDAIELEPVLEKTPCNWPALRSTARRVACYHITTASAVPTDAAKNALVDKDKPTPPLPVPWAPPRSAWDVANDAPSYATDENPVRTTGLPRDHSPIDKSPS